MNREEQQQQDQEMQYREQEAAYMQECARHEHEEQNYIDQLLSDSQTALKWMMENMAVINPVLQSDSFNIPANAIQQIEDYFNSKQPKPKGNAPCNTDDLLF